MKSLTLPQIHALTAILDSLSPHDRERLAQLLPEAETAAIEVAPHWDFELCAKRVDQVIGTPCSDPATFALRRGLLARWAQTLPVRLDAMNLPPQIMALYPAWTDRLIDFLNSDADHYDQDFWSKDVRFVLGLSVPANRTVVLDLSSPLGPRQVVMNAAKGHGIAPVFGWLGTRGWGCWLENHTDSRELGDFNPEGWEKMWAHAAAILKTRPHLAGAIGSSWFYDPQLEEVSPRLAYLRQMPLANGAFSIHQGPHPIHTERASAKSPTRRALIELGQYVPCSYVIAWPRRSLIQWAERSGLI